jgi:hypothetical protein
MASNEIISQVFQIDAEVRVAAVPYLPTAYRCSGAGRKPREAC